MPGFEGLAQYHPALVLLLGLLTFAGVLGTGLAILAALRLRFPGPWHEVAAALLGTALLSLGVQLLAMVALATRSGLVLWWGVIVLLGSVTLGARGWRAARRPPELRGRGIRLLAGIVAVAAVINLLLAMAPLTKIDELYYQLLPPSRIALDGELVFHLRPWPAAVLPQMGYPIAAAPLHALGSLDAASVWSWCLSMLLAWFVARLVHEETRSAFVALLAAASVAVGLYPSVYHTTGGPHAPGDLAAAAAVLALAFRGRLLAACTPTAYVALISLCSMMAAFTKVSLLPIAGAVLAVGVWHAVRATSRDLLRIGAAAALPWAVFFVPLCLWTLVQSGSPFGPMLSDVLGPSVFDSAVHGEMADSRRGGQQGLLFAIRGYVIQYPLVYPITLLAVLLLPAAGPVGRVAVASLFLLQAAIVAIELPHQARFLSGLHHAALVVGLIQLHPYARRCLTRPLVPVAAVVVLLGPWLGAQAYRAWFLAPIALGIGDREAYYRSYIPLYDDFRALDEILPVDAMLFVRSRLASIYSPRPVYMHSRDLPAGRRAFALLVTSERPAQAYDCEYLRLPKGCVLADPLYTNPTARFVVFRTPGDEPRRGRIEVREILPPNP